MALIRCLHITTVGDATRHMECVGVDATGIRLMEGKTLLFNLKVEAIEPRTANLLKQEMLAVGGDAAVDARGLDCSAERTDTILMGTQKQIERLTFKTEQYPILRPLGQALKETLENISKVRFSLRCGSRRLPLGERTLLMGVLNVTPDSFSDGGRYFNKEKAVAHGLRMAEEGADLIDVGGESTRPGSKPLPLEEELRRVIPVIETLGKEVSIPISIDTYKSAVARHAIGAGAHMINDISGLRFDPGLAKVAAESDVPIVLMHIRGTPETMQQKVQYDSLFSDILRSLRESIGKAESAGVDPDQILIDPGIGFGKNLDHNLLILRHLSELRVLGKPIVLGTSRKSFIGRILHEEVDGRLEGTLASIAIGAFNGAHIIRCHDVLPAKKTLAVTDAIRLAEETEGTSRKL
jgi:dihydropteroate synthase